MRGQLLRERRGYRAVVLVLGACLITTSTYQGVLPGPLRPPPVRAECQFGLLDGDTNEIASATLAGFSGRASSRAATSESRMDGRLPTASLRPPPPLPPALTAGEPPLPSSGNGLFGRYHLSGQGSSNEFTRADPAIDLEWDASAPYDDNYTISWVGWLEAPTTGNYELILDSLGSASLAIEGVPAVEQGSVSGDRVQETVALDAGKHLITIYFYTCDDFDDAHISFEWITPGQSTPVVVPQSRLYHPTGPADWQVFGAGQGGWGNDPTGRRAEPVNTATGNYFSESVDLRVPAPGLPFELKRTYNSGDDAVGVLGAGWRLSYDARMTADPGTEAVTITLGDGSRLQFELNPAGYIALPGTTADLQFYAPDAYVLTRKDGMAYSFNLDGQLVAQTDLNGNQLTFDYDVNDHLETVTDPAGREYDFTFTGDLLTSVTDPLNRTVEYAYDVNDRLETVTDLAGEEIGYTYDANGLLETITDQNGHVVVTNDYDPVSGRIVSQLNALNEETEFDWEPLTGTSTMTDPRGGEWVDVYESNLLVEVIDPLDNSTTFGYDANFNRTSVTDANGNTTTYTYDTAGNRLTETSPEPFEDVRTWTYDFNGRLRLYVDRLENETEYAYDDGNLVEVNYPDGSSEEFTYLTNGLLETSTDRNGQVTLFDYDAEWNLDSITTPLGFETTMTFDAVGRMETQVDARGNEDGEDPVDYTTTFVYDDADRLVSQTDPLDNEVVTDYDLVGNVLSVTDPNLNATTYTYDDANHLLTVTDADAGVTGYGYDEAGNLVLRIDANDHETAYEYDLAGRLTNVTDPLLNEWVTDYDDVGNLISRIDANGDETTYAYDELNRLIEIAYEDTSTPTVEYAYDAEDRMIEMVDGGGTMVYEYDDVGRLEFVGRLITEGEDQWYEDEFEYDYDDAGNVTAREWPDGTSSTYTYDDDGRLITAEIDEGPIGEGEPPTTPTGFTATLDVSELFVDFAWSAATDNVGVAGYRIEGGPSDIEVAASDLAATDWTVRADGQYDYSIVAFDALGNTSEPSAVDQVVVSDALSRYRTETLGDSPAAYWRFTEQTGTTFADEVASNDGTYATGAYPEPYGVLADDHNGMAYLYADEEGYATVPDSSDLDLGNGPFSIEVWIDANEPGDQVVLDKTSGSDGYRLAFDDGYLCLYAGGAPNLCSDVLHEGALHHYVFTRGTATDGAVYVDGVTSTDSVGSVTFSDSSTALTVGASSGGGSGFFDGVLDELAIYNTQLSAQQASDHYEIGTSALDTTNPSAPTDLSATLGAEGDTVELTWTAASDDVGVQEYWIYRDDEWVGVTSSTEFIDRDPPADATPEYTVTALDGTHNESDPSTPDSVVVPAGTPPNITTYTYDAAGNLLTADTADGISAVHTYDLAGRLLEIAHVSDTATLARTTYQLDPAGNRLVASTLQGTQYYTYDDLNRLTNVCYDVSCAGLLSAAACIECVGSPMSLPSADLTPNGSDLETTWTYDPVGNRLTEVSYLGTTDYVYDDADRMTTVDPPGSAPVTYTYDDNGNQTAAGSDTFAWDYADRLISATVDSETETYKYAGDGVRMSADRGGGDETHFVVDRNFALPQLANEVDANGNVVRRFTYGRGPISQSSQLDGTSYLYADGLGSIVAATDTAGDPVAWSAYQPFGVLRSSGADLDLPGLAFTGQYRDGATGLYHLRARQYDPVDGRFIAPDPVAQPMMEPHAAIYQYARGNPSRWADPSGEFVFAIPFVAAALMVAEAVAIGTAAGIATTIAVKATWEVGTAVGHALSDFARPRYPESQPTYDPRRDAGTWARQREMEAQMYSGHGGSIGGGSSNSSFCKAHPRWCAGFRVATVVGLGSSIFAAFHGRNPDEPVISACPN
jgi:RHS repeat-associated protein